MFQYYLIFFDFSVLIHFNFFMIELFAILNIINISVAYSFVLYLQFFYLFSITDYYN